MKTCVICGRELPERRLKYCSDECAAAGHRQLSAENYEPVRGRQGVMRNDLVCADCGTVYIGHIRTKRCPSCQTEARKRCDRESYARRRVGKSRQIGSTVLCERCGKPYMLTGGAQRYCPECAPEAVHENIRAAARERTREYYKDKTHAAEKAKARRWKRGG